MSTLYRLRDDDNGRRRFNTLEEAFGAHTSREVEPMREPAARRFADWALYLAALLAIIVIVGVA